MADFVVAVDSPGGARAWRAPFDFSGRVIAKAASKTMAEVGAKAESIGRSRIASAGFGSGWQRAFRTQVFPKPPKTALDPAVSIFHAIPYAGIFDYDIAGNSITGSPLLWVPLPGLPSHIGTKRTRPSLWPGPLRLVKMKHPTLWGYLGSEYRPLFIGLDSVQLRKRFRLLAVGQEAQALIPPAFVRNLSAANG